MFWYIDERIEIVFVLYMPFRAVVNKKIDELVMKSSRTVNLQLSFGHGQCRHAKHHILGGLSVSIVFGISCIK